ncbi:MAG TPA: acyl carrier protein [Myxococcales bacterium]|jgi:acyl carrier protein
MDRVEGLNEREDFVADQPPSTSPEATRAEIARMLRELLGIERPIDPGHDLARDLQLDSVGLLTIVVELERVYAIELREDDAQQVRTVSDLASLVDRRVAEKSAGGGEP